MNDRAFADGLRMMKIAIIPMKNPMPPSVKKASESDVLVSKMGKANIVRPILPIKIQTNKMTSPPESF